MREDVKKLIEEARKIQGVFTLSEEDLDAGSVAAALITDKGNIYTGICIDVNCGMGFCAEHSAIAEMLKHRETEIKMIVAVDRKKILPPCGRCRELMMQVDNKNALTNVIIEEDKIVQLKELLPFYWSE